MAKTKEAPAGQALGKRTRELAVCYRTLRDRKEKLEAEVKDVSGELEQVRVEFAKEMQDADLGSFDLAGVGKVYLSPVFFARAVSGQTEALISWLDQHGQGELAKRQVGWQTLQASYKDWLERNQPLPGAELVEVTSRTEARLIRK